MRVDRMGTPVFLGLRERGVHLACQALVDQESTEIRAIREDQAFLELLDHLVGMRCTQRETCRHS